MEEGNLFPLSSESKKTGYLPPVSPPQYLPPQSSDPAGPLVAADEERGDHRSVFFTSRRVFFPLCSVLFVGSLAAAAAVRAVGTFGSHRTQPFSAVRMVLPLSL